MRSSSLRSLMFKGLTIVAAIMSVTSTYAKTVVPLVTTSFYPPFAYLENGQQKGALLEFIERVAPNLPNYDMQITSMPFNKISQHIIDGNAAGYLGAYYSINRWEDVYPYSYPLFYEQHLLICNSEKSAGKDWPDEHEGTKLGTVRDYSDWLTFGAKARNLGTMNVLEFPSPDFLLRGIHLGTVDCGIFERATYAYKLAKLIERDELPSKPKLFQSSVIGQTSIHIAFSEKYLEANPKLKTFERDFNSAFHQLLQNNAFDDILERYELGVY
ncbi:hypothetical protein PN836_000700 [Ningiella sp. W23]|uniref:hypothetical protein n=1 Tax=Ningiella sp. W23 TaxID=3023715 RepID=UPI003757FF35